MSGVSESRNVEQLLYALRYPCKLTQVWVITKDYRIFHWNNQTELKVENSISVYSLKVPVFRDSKTSSDLELSGDILQDLFTATLHHEDGLTVPHSDQGDKLVPVFVHGEDGEVSEGTAMLQTQDRKPLHTAQANIVTLNWNYTVIMPGGCKLQQKDFSSKDKRLDTGLSKEVMSVFPDEILEGHQTELPKTMPTGGSDSPTLCVVLLANSRKSWPCSSCFSVRDTVRLELACKLQLPSQPEAGLESLVFQL